MARKVIALFLSLLMLCGVFTGCKDEAPTTEELMENYSDESYVYVPEDEMPMVYLFGKEDEFVYDLAIGRHNQHTTNPLYKVRSLVCTTLPIDQYGKKMQTELMSGKGPDMIITTHSDLFADMNKAVQSGAFASWDALIADWEGEYLENAVRGVYSPDEHSYLLPLSFEPMFLVTTKTNLEKYGLTEDDFINFDQTTQTLYRLCQTVDENIYPTLSRPDFTQAIDGILNHDLRKSELSNEQNSRILKQWEEMFAVLQQRSDEHPLPAVSYRLDSVMSGRLLFEFMDIDELNYALYEMKQAVTQKNYDIGAMNQIGLAQFNTEMNELGSGEGKAGKQVLEKVDDLVYIPLYDVKGRAIGTVTSYALLSSSYDGEEALKRLVERIVFIIDETGLDGIHSNADGLNLSYVSTEDSFLRNYQQGYIKGIFDVDVIWNMIKDVEWNLRVPNETVKTYHETITNYLYYPETADWEELESHINIYLSE